MKQTVKKKLAALFENHFGEKAESADMLPLSGSYREYIRLKSAGCSAIGAWNADVKENRAFLTFSAQLCKSGIPVPQIYAVGDDKTFYLQEDLGNVNLFDFLTTTRNSEGFSHTITNEYRKVLSILPHIQVTASRHIDYTVCYPRAAFDRQSMIWDLNYFKYYFLKLAKIPFDEQLLEDDFQRFADYLLTTGNDYFMYRDFQSRNIMLKGGGVFFIDYQGGRKGALQYDLASLLYDGKADIPRHVREELLHFYLDRLEEIVPVDRNEFVKYYKGFVIIRILQAMGAYGFRGFYEKKEHFLKSIPYALDNLNFLLQNLDLPVSLPELTRALHAVCDSEFLRSFTRERHKLTVSVTSFSYKKGIPGDASGNGGGFVFDCRSVNNPGRYPKFKMLTGKDIAVQQFLEEKSEIEVFLNAVYALVGQSVRMYLERGFTHLAVNFGCTGGQHRSVYSAEKTAEFLQHHFPVTVELIHRELESS